MWSLHIQLDLVHARSLHFVCKFRNDDVPANYLRSYAHVPAARVSLHQFHRRLRRGRRASQLHCCLLALDSLFSDLGLESSPEKDSPSSACKVFLGIQIDTSATTTTVTPARLQDLQARCAAFLSSGQLSRADLQSLFGVMWFVTACVRPARFFMDALLSTLRSAPAARSSPLTAATKEDLLWCVHFLPLYNGVSIIKAGPPIDDPLFFSTDFCLTGCGAYFRGSFRARHCDQYSRKYD